MKYVILENRKLADANEASYNKWINNKGNKYILPIYISKNKNIIHTIDTDFAGALEEYESVRPFILFHYEQEVKYQSGGSIKHLIPDTEYFETFEAMEKRRAELISGIQAA